MKTHAKYIKKYTYMQQIEVKKNNKNLQYILKFIIYMFLISNK